jgi:hypothetical protein
MQAMRFRRVLKNLIIISMAAGSLVLLSRFLLWNLYSAYLPSVPDPATGHVYRLVEHDLVVYQTRREHIIYWTISAGWYVLFGLGVLWIVVYDWIPDKQDRRID